VTETSGHMVRVGRSVEVSCMALVAISIRQLIVAVHVARLTRSSCVCTGQREIRRRMVEGCGTPIQGCMALGTVMTEIPCDVVRICRAVEICSMALITIVVYQLVIPIHVARLTLHCYMGARQREVRRCVVEGSTAPIHRAMALLAVMTEISSHMIRVRRPVEIGRVALVAIVIH